MNDRLVRYKESAMAFYDLIFNQFQPAEALERYVGDTCYAAQSGSHRGLGRVHRILRTNDQEIPRKRVQFNRVIAEGKQVVLQCHQEWPGDQHWVEIDIFRFNDNGNITELWT